MPLGINSVNACRATRCTYRFTESPSRNEMQINMRELNKKKTTTFEIAMTAVSTRSRVSNLANSFQFRKKKC